MLILLCIILAEIYYSSKYRSYLQCRFLAISSNIKLGSKRLKVT
jgi:hypothetical protein